MEVKSKFNIGHTIFFMERNRPIEGIIEGISFFVGEKKSNNGAEHKMEDGKCLIEYHVHAEEAPKIVVEQNAYPSKDDLKKSIFV